MTSTHPQSMSRLISLASAIEKLELYIPALQYDTLMRYTSALNTLVKSSNCDVSCALQAVLFAYAVETSSEPTKP